MFSACEIVRRFRSTIPHADLGVLAALRAPRALKHSKHVSSALTSCNPGICMLRFVSYIKD